MAMWAQRYMETMIHELGMTAHSCGVREPRRRRRFHARAVAPDGRPVRTNEMRPDVEPTITSRPTARPGVPAQ